MRTCRFGVVLCLLLLFNLARIGKIAFTRCLVIELEGSAVSGAANSAGLAAATFWAGSVTLGRLEQAKGGA